MNSCYGFLLGLGAGTVAGVGVSMMNPKKTKEVKVNMEDTFSRFGSAVEEAATVMMNELQQG